MSHIDTSKVLTPDEFLSCMPQCCQDAIIDSSVVIEDGSPTITWHWKCKNAPVDCRDMLIYYSEARGQTGRERLNQLINSLSRVCPHCTKPQMDIRSYNDRTTKQPHCGYLPFAPA